MYNRHRLIALGSVASIFAKGTQTIAMLIITAIATRSFTKEEFGFWVILLSFLYSGYAFDFGFRSALTNRLTAMVADSSGKANNNQRDFFLSIFNLQFGIGLLGAIIFIFIGNLISWSDILKIHQTNILSYASSLIIIIFVILFLNVSFLSSSSGFFAYHEVHIDSLLQAAQWIVLMFEFWFTTSYRLLPFNELVILFFLTFFLIGVIRTVILFKHHHWSYKWISIRDQWYNIKAISSVSFDFFLLNISALTISIGSTFLAGLIGGLVSVGDFSLIQRLFTVLITIHMAFMAAFNPSFTSDARKGNWGKVLRKLNFNLYFIVPLLFVLIGGLILVFHPLILKLWTGLNIENYTLTGFFAIYALFMGWGNTNSILLSSLGLVRAQAIWSFSIVPVFLFLTFYLSKSLGVNGIALASLISSLPSIIYFTFYTKKAIKQRRINV